MKKALLISLLVLVGCARGIIAQEVQYTPLQMGNYTLMAVPIELEEIGVLRYYLIPSDVRYTTMLSVIHNWLERQGFIIDHENRLVIDDNVDLDMNIKRAMNRAGVTWSVTVYESMLYINTKQGGTWAGIWSTVITPIY